MKVTRALSWRGALSPLVLLVGVQAWGASLVEYRASSGSPPSLPVWGQMENGSPPGAQVVDGILRQGPVSKADSQTWFAEVPFDFNSGTSWVEWRMRVIESDWYQVPARWRTGWRLRCISNLAQEYLVGFTKTFVILGDNWDGLAYTETNAVKHTMGTTDWHTYRLDLTPGWANLSVDGQPCLSMQAGPGVHPSLRNELDFGDGSYHVGTENELEYFVVGAYGVRVRVGLRDWMPSVAGKTVDVELLDSSGNVVRSETKTVGDDGTVFVASPAGVPVRARVKASHWLSHTIPDLVDPRGSDLLICELVNGDCDGDNVVTVFDYNVLSDAFDTMPGDAGWNADADLDGDEAVTVYDYNIVSASFDLSGD